MPEVPFNPVNVGVTPNDGSGDPNRVAFEKINAMLLGVIATLPGVALNDAVTDMIANLASQLTDINEAIALKANSNGLSAYALKNSVIEVNKTSPFFSGASPNHYPFATLHGHNYNAGSMVTLCFVVVPQQTFLNTATYSIEIPPFPVRFAPVQVRLTPYNLYDVNRLAAWAQWSDVGVTIAQMGAADNLIGLSETDGWEMTMWPDIDFQSYEGPPLYIGKQQHESNLQVHITTDGGLTDCDGLVMWVRGFWKEGLDTVPN
jgi:hypothetical protein